MLLLGRIAGDPREPEIRDLRMPIPKEYVGGLEIPMQYVLASHLLEPLIDFPEQGQRLRLRQPAPGLEQAGHVPVVAVLGDDVAIVHCRVDVVAAEDVLVGQLL